MKNKFSEEELKAIASQLSHPKGEMGMEVSKTMHQSNISMTEKAIELLHLEEEEQLLELGHGNGHHVPELFGAYPTIRYSGLEISELMHEEAKKANAGFIENKQAAFYLYDGQNIPFEDNHFDKIMTVNTIYFWKEPQKMAAEIHRVLKEGGSFSLAFAQKRFMETLPFTQYGFTYYDDQKVEDLMYDTGFTIVEQSDIKETLKSKDLREVEREFTVMRFLK
ncbi:class I SAM-dependent methyltransferase [Echinicola sediminis]